MSRALVFSRLDGSYGRHASSDAESLLTVLERLSEVVPEDATWYCEEEE